MSAKIPEIKLNNSLSVPIVGLGTYTPANEKDDNKTYEAVKTAIKVGYRHIDTAYCYQNEVPIGKAINECIKDGLVKREDLWVTTKLWMNFFAKDRVALGLQKSLQNLQLDYVDLFLMHWPMVMDQKDDLLFDFNEANIGFDDKISIYTDTWPAMEELVKKGLTRSIGVSNFTLKQLQKLLTTATIKPVVNQVECHPCTPQKQLLEYCRKENIVLTAYSPFGGSAFHSSQNQPEKKTVRGELLKSEVLANIATKYNKSVNQILLKFNTQRGVMAIPKSTSEKNILANADLFDFELTNDEITALEGLENGLRHVWMEPFKNTKNYPFDENN